MNHTTNPQDAKAEALLLHFAAEAHRRKWSYDRGLDDDGVPVKSEAFDALHRLGEEMRTALEALRRTPAVSPSAVVSADRATLRDRIAAAMREHWLCTVRDEADADGNLPCRCGDWREPGAEVDDENDWDSHLADVALAVLPTPADRATLLREAADIAESLRQFERCTGPRRAAQTSENVGILRVADHLRQLAVEADGSRVAAEEQPAETQAEHVCKPGAGMYFCPTSGKTESTCHGGFDVCCDRPELHKPAETPASTAPLAAGLPLVKGRCPACGRASLFLGNGGYVTCSVIECAEPDAASTLLEPAEPWLTDSARIGRALIWSWSDVGKGAFGEGYRAAQAEARALLGGGRGTEQQRPAVGEQPDTQTREALCRCSHTRKQHIAVSGRLLCDACDPDSTENRMCEEFEAL